MPLIQVNIRNIRLYEQQEFNPHPRLTLITGDNASGKTTLLEAIHLLSTGKSFRIQKLDKLQRHGAEDLSVSGLSRDKNNVIVRLGFSQDQEGRHARIDGAKPKKFSDLAQQLPLLVISPDSHYDFQLQSRTRRAAIDWVLFHVEQDFQGLWNRYQRTLQQRNAALKDVGQSRARFSWDQELASLGDEIQTRRIKTLRDLAPKFKSICHRILSGSSEAGLMLESGWKHEQGMAASLVEDRQRDLARGFTHSGPHRNDLHLLLDGLPSRDVASHGQNKLLVIALRLAQIEYLHSMTGRECCLLIDDLAAEIDVEHRRRLIKDISRLPVQVFITAIDPEQIDTSAWQEMTRFHVEQGVIRAQ